MTDHPRTTGLGWALDACTLRTAGQPLRIAELGSLFAATVWGSKTP